MIKPELPMQGQQQVLQQQAGQAVQGQQAVYPVYLLVVEGHWDSGGDYGQLPLKGRRHPHCGCPGGPQVKQPLAGNHPRREVVQEPHPQRGLW